MSEREDAKRATNIIFGSRFEGMPKITPDYQGEFPCREVAMSVPITDYPHLKDHQVCWNRQYAMFDKAWDAFHMKP